MNCSRNPDLETTTINETEMVFGNFEGKDVRSGSFTVEPFQGGHFGGTPVDIGHPSKSWPILGVKAFSF